jgi:hypothetical protein
MNDGCLVNGDDASEVVKVLCAPSSVRLLLYANYGLKVH